MTIDSLQNLPEGIYLTGLLAVGMVLGKILHGVLFAALRRVNRRAHSTIIASTTRHLRGPSSYMLVVLLATLTLNIIAVDAPLYDPLLQVLQIFLVITIAWVLIKSEDVFEDLIREKFDLSKADNIRERAIHTQMNYIRKILIVVVVVVALGIILMSFEPVRRVGGGLLASAGVAGLLIGMAAQTSLKNLLAGLQIAFTQPIRYDDVVIVEGEWGWIEEITLTYVVVRIWDLRRLVLPLHYFIERPFQNWTKTSADILGTVYIYADYTLPIEPVRQALIEYIHKHPLWDKKAVGLQVTNTSEKGMELRALVSAANSADAWNLRCDTREFLITFIQKNYPRGLSRIRVEVEKAAARRV